jgi:hypothetical protein
MPRPPRVYGRHGSSRADERPPSPVDGLHLTGESSLLFEGGHMFRVGGSMGGARPELPLEP